MAGTPIERVLRRDRLITAAGIGVLCALAWAYLITGAGLGMPLAEMTRAALFPHTLAGSATAGQIPAWSPWEALLMVLMWWVMMIAMMTPSAAPMILLHARVARHAQAGGKDPQGVLDRTAVFCAGYLLVWLAFSILATALQTGLQAAGLVSALGMWSASGVLSAAVLVTAGVYQWTPLKNACLAHCRAPVQFLTRHWRPGRLGALRLGMRHGAYCVGCCWALMALLFVGGVMNALWIAALTVVVLVEKLASAGAVISRVGGALLVLWGIATLWA